MLDDPSMGWCATAELIHIHHGPMPLLSHVRYSGDRAQQRAWQLAHAAVRRLGRRATPADRWKWAIACVFLTQPCRATRRARYAHSMRVFVFNSGLFYIRPTPAALELLDRLVARVESENGWDQAIFNEASAGRPMPDPRRAEQTLFPGLSDRGRCTCCSSGSGSPYSSIVFSSPCPRSGSWYQLGLATHCCSAGFAELHVSEWLCLTASACFEAGHLLSQPARLHGPAREEAGARLPAVHELQGKSCQPSVRSSASASDAAVDADRALHVILPLLDADQTLVVFALCRCCSRPSGRTWAASGSICRS